MLTVLASPAIHLSTDSRPPASFVRPDRIDRRRPGLPPLLLRKQSRRVSDSIPRALVSIGNRTPARLTLRARSADLFSRCLCFVRSAEVPSATLHSCAPLHPLARYP